MVDEGYIRKVKYGVIVFILICFEIYLILQPHDMFVDFFSTTIHVFLIYFGFRFILIMTMHKHRFIKSIDVLICRLVDEITDFIKVLMTPPKRREGDQYDVIIIQRPPRR